MTVYEYLVLVEQQIRQKSMSQEIVRELRQHVDDQAEAFCEEGMDPDAAMERAVEEMGDPVETGILLDQVHQPRPDVKLLCLLLGLDLLFTVFQWAVLGGGSFNGGQIIWKGTGMVMMCIMGLTKYSDDLRKHPLVLWAVFLVAGVWIALLEVKITGSSQSFRLSMEAALNLSLMGFAGMAFRQRGGGMRRLGRLLAMGGAACALSLLTGSYAYITLLITAHVLILTIAVRRGWFVIDRKKSIGLLWLPSALLVLGGAAPVVRGVQKGWYREQAAAYGEEADIPGLMIRTFGEDGVIPVVIWVLLIGLIMWWFVRDVRRITNQFCSIMSIGILLGIAIPVLNSCLAILGYGSLNEIYFPFASAPRFQDCSYIYFYYWGAGIFLHLYRNDRVIPRVTEGRKMQVWK